MRNALTHQTDGDPTLSSAATLAQIRVFLIDDRAIAREGTRRILAAEPDFDIVGEAGELRTGVRRAMDAQPHVLLVVASLADPAGLQAIRRLRAALPRLSVLVLDCPEDSAALEQTGIAGCLPRTASSPELLHALRLVAAGGTYFSSSDSEHETSATNSMAPTSRELEVLRLVQAGYKNRAIAQRLKTSERTVQFHVGNLFNKLGAGSRTEMVFLARQRGWLD